MGLTRLDDVMLRNVGGRYGNRQYAVKVHVQVGWDDVMLRNVGGRYTSQLSRWGVLGGMM